ncbi:unnamed protein product [Prunus armeniaca]|nr:unnamed protein product [Prunus armeniaca]
MAPVWPGLEKPKELGGKKKMARVWPGLEKSKDLVDAKGNEIRQYNCFVVEFPSVSF